MDAAGPALARPPEPGPVRRALEEALERRILLLDGAMATMIQRHGLDEAAIRGTQFRDHGPRLTGNHDLLVLTQPAVVAGIHEAYLAAGADIIATNTFSSTAIAQADYGLEGMAGELNRAAAGLAAEVAHRWTRRTPDRPRFVAGAIGPTSRTLSMSPDVHDPARRTIAFETMRVAYLEQVRGLLDGGADLLLLETVFDALNAKAAILAVLEETAARQQDVPLMISVTLSDRSGRTLAGQTLEAFCISVAHARPFSVGLNCGLGARAMRGHLAELARLAPAWVSCHPNAGLPNAFGEYDEEAQETAALLRDAAASGLVNILGGCCGTTPAHIAAIARAADGLPPRPRPAPPPPGVLRLAGLEPLAIGPEPALRIVGERTNVTGSRRFARMIAEGRYADAAAVALDQTRGGASILDVNMDEGMLDAVAAMRTFLNLIGSDPDVARVPMMIDSSRWEVVEAGLACVQGRPLVNSISLKDGAAEFLRRARRLRAFGAAPVVMAFDEQGQADTRDRRVAICQRAYGLLVADGTDPSDIVFDPNMLAVATGLEEHARAAIDVLEAMRAIRASCPGAHLTGGVSNLSFAFRGQETVREAIHAIFLEHAVAAGLDLAIVNAGRLPVPEVIPAELRTAIEDVLFDRHRDATDRLVRLASTMTGGEAPRHDTDLTWRDAPVEDRLAHALVHGVLDFLEVDVEEARRAHAHPLEVIEGPLMTGMALVGERFGAGRMFLPQVVRSARVMKRAVTFLLPYMDASGSFGTGRQGGRGTVVVATVKGDVHDIGKNIVSVVLGCNGYRVVDLGVMVPADRILEAAVEEGAVAVGLSGLITPSLDEMVFVAREMARRGMDLPLLVGGATTSRQHTAVRLAPEYDGLVVHVLDAARVAGVVQQLADPSRRDTFAHETRAAQAHVRDQHAALAHRRLLRLEEAVANRPRTRWTAERIAVPSFTGRRVLDDVPLGAVVPYIDWTPFFPVWELKGRFPAILDHPRYGEAARDLYVAAQALLGRLVQEKRLIARAVYGLWPANADGEDLVLYESAPGGRRGERMRFPMLRQQEAQPDGRPNRSLADAVAPLDSGLTDYMGAFAVSAGFGIETIVEACRRAQNDYDAIMVQALADRLAEALAEYLHARVRREWGYGGDERLAPDDLVAGRYRGIRPAFGYPACPDHSGIRPLFALLDAGEAGFALTESCMMMPASSVSGLYFADPEATYFAVGRLGRDQVEDYARRTHRPVAAVERWLAPHLAYEREDVPPTTKLQQD